MGDSISAGFGIECTDSSLDVPNLYTYENSYLTSASDLANSFEASLTIIAESGAGESISHKALDIAPQTSLCTFVQSDTQNTTCSYTSVPHFDL